MFKNVHHRSRRYLRVGSSEDPLQDDTNQYRCKVCGFICDKRRVTVAKSRRNATKLLTGIKLVADADGDSYYTPTVTKGCPKCGTMYSRHK